MYSTGVTVIWFSQIAKLNVPIVSKKDLSLSIESRDKADLR